MRQPDLPPSVEEDSGTGFALPLKLRLKRFHLDQVELNETLLGRASAFEVFLNLNSRTATTLHSELKITPLEEGDGFVTGDVVYSLETNRLGVFTEIEGPQDGLLSRLLGLPGYPAVSASLIGDGPISDWQGQVTARADGLFSGDLLVLAKGESVIEVEISGGVNMSEKMAADIPLLDDRRITINTNLLFDRQNNDLTIQSAHVESTAVKVTAEGRVALETLDIKGALQASVVSVAPVNDLIAPAALSGLSITTDVDGNLDSLQTDTNIAIKGVQIASQDGMPPLKVDQIKGKISSALALGQLAEVPFMGTVMFSGVSGMPPEVANVVGEQIILNTQGAYSLKAAVLDLQSLIVKAAHIETKAEGRVFTGHGPTEMTIVTTLDDLKALQPTMEGAVRLVSQLTSSDLTQNVAGRLDAVISDFDMGNPDVQKLLGRNVSLGADISLLGDMVTVDARLPFEVGEVKANAEIPTSFETVNAKIMTNLPSLDALSEVAGVLLKGKSKLTVDIEGPIADRRTQRVRSCLPTCHLMT